MRVSPKGIAWFPKSRKICMLFHNPALALLVRIAWPLWAIETLDMSEVLIEPACATLGGL